MRHLKSPNIVQLRGYFEDTDYIILVTELMTEDVRTILKGCGSSLDEMNVKEIFYQMLKAIKLCHARDIVHRDVKLENFLIDIDCQGKLLVKLGDFGLACHFQHDNPPTSKCGSITTIAPEMLTCKSYCHKVDMWALGIILH